MPRQRVKRKIKVFFHCLFRLHRRGIIHCENHNGTEKWRTWACATCAEAAPWFRHTKSKLTQDDLDWAAKVAKNLGWNK